MEQYEYYYRYPPKRPKRVFSGSPIYNEYIIDKWSRAITDDNTSRPIYYYLEYPYYY